MLGGDQDLAFTFCNPALKSALSPYILSSATSAAFGHQDSNVCTKTEWGQVPTVPIYSVRLGTCGIGGASSDGALEVQRLLHSVTKIPQLYRCELLKLG